jgi:hypothetical protein
MGFMVVDEPKEEQGHSHILAGPVTSTACRHHRGWAREAILPAVRGGAHRADQSPFARAVPRLLAQATTRHSLLGAPPEFLAQHPDSSRYAPYPE